MKWYTLDEKKPDYYFPVIAVIKNPERIIWVVVWRAVGDNDNDIYTLLDGSDRIIDESEISKWCLRNMGDKIIEELKELKKYNLSWNGEYIETHRKENGQFIESSDIEEIINKWK